MPAARRGRAAKTKAAEAEAEVAAEEERQKKRKEKRRPRKRPAKVGTRKSWTEGLPGSCASEHARRGQRRPAATASVASSIPFSLFQSSFSVSLSPFSPNFRFDPFQRKRTAVCVRRACADTRGDVSLKPPGGRGSRVADPRGRPRPQAAQARCAAEPGAHAQVWARVPDSPGQASQTAAQRAAKWKKGSLTCLATKRKLCRRRRECASSKQASFSPQPRARPRLTG